MTDLFRQAQGKNNRSLEQLFQFGGFPAPFLAARKTSHAEWIRTRKELLLREDVRDLSRIEDIAALELLTKLIEPRVGSLLNYQNLAGDLNCSVDSVRRWIRLLESLYYIYTIPPYTRNIKRSLRKMPKIYFWDWSEVPGEGARFENLIASNLLKAVHYWTDTGKGNFDLYYIRTKEKKEVDFLVTQDKAPFLLVEAKWKDTSPHGSLRYFQEVLQPTYACQVVSDLPPIQQAIPKTCGVIAATDFCGSLP